MIITGLLFVGVAGTVRYVGSDMPALEAAFIRYAIGLLFVLPPLVRFLLRYARPNKPDGTLWMLIVRGVLHSFAVTFWFFAMARIPVAEVVAISYAAPIFVTIGAALFLGERLKLRRIAAVLISIIGVLVILRPGFEVISIGQFAQLAATPFFAASVLIAKRLTSSEDPSSIVAMLSLVCTLALLPGALLNWREPSVEECLWLALTAVFATLGHYTMTLAYRAAPITITLPVTFLQLVWATLLGIIAFGEALDPFVIVGGGVIVAAATYISWREAKVRTT